MSNEITDLHHVIAEMRDAARDRGPSDSMGAQLARWADRLEQATGAEHGKTTQVYDQQALELCTKCGWKAVVPGEGCLNCERDKAPVSLCAQAKALQEQAVRNVAARDGHNPDHYWRDSADVAQEFMRLALAGATGVQS